MHLVCSATIGQRWGKDGPDCLDLDSLCLPPQGGNGCIPHISMSKGGRHVGYYSQGKTGVRRGAHIFYLIRLFSTNNTYTHLNAWAATCTPHNSSSVLWVCVCMQPYLYWIITLHNKRICAYIKSYINWYHLHVKKTYVSLCLKLCFKNSNTNISQKYHETKMYFFKAIFH